MKKRLIAMILSFGTAALFAAEVPKEGGLCFRFDDNKTVRQWTRLAEVFNRYGIPFSAAFNTQGITGKPEYKTLLKNLEAAGHELLDHTPDHRVYAIQARSGEELARYRKEPGVHHADEKTRWVYLNYIPDLEHPGNRPFCATVRGNELTDVSTEDLRFLHRAAMVYVPQAGEVFGVMPDKTTGVLKLVSFWGEDNVNLPEMKNMELLRMGRYAVSPTDDGLRFLARESAANFRKMGLKAPTGWAQPGGWDPPVGTGELARIYGGEFGYIAADSQTGAWPWWCCFDDPEPFSRRFQMVANGETLEKDSVARMKTLIADLTAKHRVMIMLSHMAVYRIPGGFRNFLKRHDELLKWIHEKKIPVRTVSGWSRVLYGERERAPQVNIMPSLTRDLDENGRPDGYVLNNGTTAKNGVLLFPGRDGRVFTVSGLAGLEKEENRFRFSCKAVPGTKLVFQFRTSHHGQGRHSLEQSLEFPVTKNGWQTYSGIVRIPRRAVVMDVICRLENAQGPAEWKDPGFQAERRDPDGRERYRRRRPGH